MMMFMVGLATFHALSQPASPKRIELMVAACDDCVERRTCTEGDGEEEEENDIRSYSSELMSHCDSSERCRRDIYG